MKSASLSNGDELVAIPEVLVSMALDSNNESDHTLPQVERILDSIDTGILHKSLIESGEGSKEDYCVYYYFK